MFATPWRTRFKRIANTNVRDTDCSPLQPCHSFAQPAALSRRRASCSSSRCACCCTTSGARRTSRAGRALLLSWLLRGGEVYEVSCFSMVGKWPAVAVAVVVCCGAPRCLTIGAQCANGHAVAPRRVREGGGHASDRKDRQRGTHGGTALQMIRRRHNKGLLVVSTALIDECRLNARDGEGAAPAASVGAGEGVRAVVSV